MKTLLATISAILFYPQFVLAAELNTLDDYISHALAHSSALETAYNDYIAATYRAPQARTLSDPRLSYGYFIESVETRVGPQQHKIGIAQSFPWFGTLSIRGDIADQQAKAEFYRFLSKKNYLVFNLSKAYTELAYVIAAIEITNESIKLVQSWENVLQERFKTGSGTHSDLVKVQVELGKLEDRLAELRDLKMPIAIQLNSLLNREATQSTIIDKNFLNDSMEINASFLKQSISFANVRENNPELSMLKAVVEAKNAGVKLAEKKFYPNFTLGIDYIATGERDTPGGGDDALMGTLSLTLPIYRNKNAAALSEARAIERSLEQRILEKEFELKAIFAKAEYELRDSQRKVNLYRDTLISKAKESTEASYTAYQSGEASFLDVIDSEERLLEFKLSLKRAEANRIIAISKLNMIAGGFSKIPSLEMEISK
jgi:outer membrane protein TolC